MRNVSLGMVIAGVVAVGLLGCGDDDGPTVVKKPFSMYSDASTPQEVLDDLQIAYRRREIEPYAALLAADFRFHFLEDDALGLPRDFYTHDEDSLATGHLFDGQDLGGTGGNVLDIRVDLTLAPPDTATLERFPGEEFLRIRATVNLLDVDLSNGTTLRVVDQTELFYFRPGRSGLGEDPDRWYLVSWMDMGFLFGKAFAGPAIRAITWGAIKSSGFR